MEVTSLLERVNAAIINPTILLLFAVATVVFVWGLVQFVSSAETDDGRETGKRKILWGLIGMFIMFSALGIIQLVLNTFGVPTTGLFIF